MAVWVRDSFGAYATAHDAVLPGGKWDGNDGIFGEGWGLSSDTPFGYGRSLLTSAIFGGWIYKISPAGPQMTAMCMCHFKCDTGPWFISFDDDPGNAQLNIAFDGNSYISFNNAHGELARWNKAYALGIWTHIQFLVKIGHTDGVIRARLNGRTSDDFEICNVDTQVSANKSTNCVRLVTQNNSAFSRVKDFAAWDLTGPGPWNTWMGHCRAQLIMPRKDISAVLSKVYPSGDSLSFGFPGNASASTLTANRIFIYPVDPPTIGGVLSDLTITMHAGVTGTIQAAIYTAGGDFNGIEGNGAAAGELLAATDELVNPVTGDNTMTWSGGNPSLATKAKYWLALWGNVDFTPRFQAGAVGDYDLADTYDGSPMSPFRQDLANFNGASWPPTLFGTITPSNAACAGEPIEDGATTYVESDTPGDADLYLPEKLPPKGFKNIVGADLMMLYAKSTAGSRGVKGVLKSGATTVKTIEEAPSTTFNYVVKPIDSDPNTGLPWVKSDLEAVNIGPEVSS